MVRCHDPACHQQINGGILCADVVADVHYEPYVFSHSVLSATAAAHPPAWSVGSC